MIKYADLDFSERTKQLTLQLIFARGVRADIQCERDKELQQTKEELALMRNKERSISFIIEKVTQWRKLYNGFYDEN